MASTLEADPVFLVATVAAALASYEIQTGRPNAWLAANNVPASQKTRAARPLLLLPNHNFARWIMARWIQHGFDMGGYRPILECGACGYQPEQERHEDVPHHCDGCGGTMESNSSEEASKP